MKKRAISLLLAFVMLFSLLPVQVFAAEEPEYLPEAEIEEQYVSDGAFYFASAGAELYENTGSGYLLKVARWGDGEEAASVRLTMTDVTASYGEDYTVSLYGAGLFEGVVKNGAKSESILEYLQNHETEEYNYSDAIIDGTITAEDQPAEGENNIELTEEQKSEIENASNELVAAISGTTPDEVDTTIYDAESTGSVLSAAREKATGLKDDREPAAYGAPAVSGTGSSSDSVANMADSITEVSNALNASYIVINFDEGITERYVEILPHDNSKSDGNRQSNFDLSGEDGAEVSAMYSSFTLKLIDDEPYVPDVVEFSDTEYYPEDGYVTVTVKRTGNLTGVLTAMLYTVDDTAIGGLDYSQVDAKLTFGFGMSEREVKIPVRSDYLKTDVRFKLILSEPQECVIGENSTAYCVIRKNDTSFKTPAKSSAALGAGLVGATEDMDLDTVIVGEEFCLPDMYQGCYLTNNDCRSQALGENGWQLYAHKHGDDVEAAAAFELDTWHYDYSGYEVSWSRRADKPTWGSTKFWSYTGGINFDTLYNKDTERWSNDVDQYFLHTDVTTLFEFHLYAETNILAKNPTLDIYYVKPILRPFQITMMGADPIKLIDSNGNKVENTEIDSFATENEVLLANADSYNSVVTTTGNSVTFTLRNNVSPICYISGLYMVNTETGEKVLVQSYPEGTTNASLEITNDLIAKNVDFVEFKANNDHGDHGKYGAFTIQPELKNMPATVHVEKSDRGTVTVWDGSLMPIVSSDANETVYSCSVGDAVRYNVKVNEDLTDMYDWERVEIKTLRPAGRQTIDIYRVTGKDYAQDVVSATEISTRALITDDINRLIVRVKVGDLDKFDTTTGIFTKGFEYYRSALDGIEYRDYAIDANRVAGKRYELTAKAKDGYIAEWCTANKTAVKYSQEMFYYQAAPDSIDNILLLSPATPDEMNYSLTGTVYYDDAALGGTVSAEAWYPASGAYYIIDSAHYGIANMNGLVKTAPFKGIAGDYIRYKVTVAGYEDYSDILLKQEKLETTEYENTEGGTYTVSSYVMDIANRIVSVTNAKRPHAKSAVAKYDIFKTSSTEVKISGRSTEFTVTIAINDPATGEPYEYTYIDEKGVTQTRQEHPKAVDIVIIDPVTHEEKFAIAAKRATIEKWTASYTFKHDEYNKYKAGDLVYIRLTTDRWIGDGCTENENGERIPVDAFRETVYAPVRTKMTLSGINPQKPLVVNIAIDPTNHIPQEGNYYSLPLIGDLTMMINAVGLSFGIAETETGGVRLFFGKQIMSLTKNSHFDGYGNPVNDTGSAEVSRAAMDDIINVFGTKNKIGAMALGIPAWSFEPMAGIYMEFAVYNDPESDAQQRLEFVGGGGYIGAIANFRYTYYMVVLGWPVYVGGDVSITLAAELGIAADQNVHLFLDEVDQDFITNVIDQSHFQFIFMAIVTGNAYAGVGICGTAGARGGFSLVLKFIANPMVTKSYPSVRSSGFEVTGSIKFWLDAVLFTIPVAPLSWDLLKLGYFADIDKLKEDNPSLFLNPAPTAQPISSKPRSTDESTFVGDRKLVQSTFSPISSRPIIQNSYDDAQQKLIELGDGRILMVYLDDVKTRDANERTALKYSVYSNGEWSTPVIIQNDGTADFSPDVCDAGSDVIITWVSRPEEINDPDDYRAHVAATEIYTVRMNKSTLDLGDIERLTDDDYYDTDPAAIYDSDTGDVVIVYSKSEVGAINDSNDLLNTVMPYTNGSVLMYMLYDGESGEWVHDRFFENEIANPEDADSLLTEFKGQRFVPTAAFGMTNPIISDLAADSCLITNLNAKDLADFDEQYADEHGISYEESSDGGVKPSEEEIQAYLDEVDAFKDEWTKPYGLYAYTVDKDNNLSTDSDREVFVQLYEFGTHKTWESIQITNNDENDSAPQLIHVGDTAYLFWLHDGKEIRYINATDTMCEADSEGFVRYRTVTARSADTDIDDLSISSFRAFADHDQNLFVAWQQNSAPVDEENTNLNPTQDIYLAGYVNYSDDAENYSSWSDAIRMTDNGKLNDLPEFADLGDGRLMMVNSQYDIDMNDDIYTVSDVNLVETDYTTVGSLKVVDVVPRTIPKKAGDEFSVDIVIRNDGVKAESGFEYSGALMAGGHAVQQFNGELATSVPAGRTVTLTQKFTLPDNAADALNTLNIQMYIKENDTEKPILSGAPLFDGKPRYELTDIKAVQEGNCFCISGFARNVGSGKCDGTDRIDIFADGSDTALTSVRLGAGSEINTAVPFSAVVDIDPENAKYGFVNYVLIAHSADDSPCSNIETVRAALVNPFNLCLNGDNSLDEITINKGQLLSLSTTYEPTTFYRNANVKYAVDDVRVATISGNCLVGLEEGETTLRMTVDPYGGSKTVNIIVTDSSHDFDDDEYEIELSPNMKNGKVEVNPKSASAGQIVTITVKPDKGFSLETLTVLDENGKEIEIQSPGGNKYSFNMPSGEVTVEATFMKDNTTVDSFYEIEIPSNMKNGKVEVSPKNASAGQTVTITVKPDKGFSLETLTVLDEIGNEIEVKNLGGNKYSFNMPSGKVTVEATFMEDNTMLNFFVDVPATEYYYDAVLWAAENGVTNGTDAMHFSPDAPVTRAQVVTFLWRAAGRPQPAGSASKFVDVPADAYYEKAVAWAIEQGVTKGTSTMTFTPDAVCTRGQIVTFLARFAGMEDADTASVFSDVKSTDYFAAAVKWAKENGVTEGTSATMFSPNNNCTRAQVVTFLYRWMVK